MEEYINGCASITKKKGFDTSELFTQLLLIGTEIQEALEVVSEGSSSSGLMDYIVPFETLMISFEEYRKTTNDHYDDSYLLPRYKNQYLEELADIVIRVFSHVGGNDWTDDFVKILKKKIQINKKRKHKHGKKF